MNTRVIAFGDENGAVIALLLMSLENCDANCCKGARFAYWLHNRCAVLTVRCENEFFVSSLSLFFVQTLVKRGNVELKKEMFSRCRNVSRREWNHSCFHAHVVLYALLEEIKSILVYSHVKSSSFKFVDQISHDQLISIFLIDYELQEGICSTSVILIRVSF